ncbi:MAG TPA: YkgJ family cysteine cluster protein [Verrucomicrobiae bacterium]
MPAFYQCQRCTACCRWPGQVRLTDTEIPRLAAFLRFSEFDFIQRFTRLSSDRRGLALQEKPNGECVFLQGNDCAVQSVKPQQCRDFPNLWRVADLEQSCRAIPIPVTPAEWRCRVAAATGRTIEDIARVAGDSSGADMPGLERSSAPFLNAEIP